MVVRRGNARRQPQGPRPQIRPGCSRALQRPLLHDVTREPPSDERDARFAAIRGRLTKARRGCWLSSAAVVCSAVARALAQLGRTAVTGRVERSKTPKRIGRPVIAGMYGTRLSAYASSSCHSARGRRQCQFRSVRSMMRLAHLTGRAGPRAGSAGQEARAGVIAVLRRSRLRVGSAVVGAGDHVVWLGWRCPTATGRRLRRCSSAARR